MSVNDPDGEPYQELSREEFIAILLRAQWSQAAAEKEWERFEKPVYICDLRW